MQTPTNIADPGKRLVAYLIDALILGTAFAIIFGITIVPTIMKFVSMQNEEYPMDDSEAVTMIASSLGIMVLGILVYYIGVFLYYTLQHSGKYQATFGKRAMKLYVSDESGNKLTFGQAAIRFLGKIINSFTMAVGYIIILFTDKKQGLHDIIAKTLVLDGSKENIAEDFEELQSYSEIK